MEMAMLDTGNNKLPEGVTEERIPIHFKDKLKTEGLKVFQSLMFSKGGAYDLWWTGQEFKVRDVSYLYDLTCLGYASRGL